ISRPEVCQHLLDEPFASPVRIHWNTRMRFVGWRVAWLAVEGGGRREHHRRRAISQHGSQQVQCAGNVVIEVEQWVAGQLTGDNLSGEMYYGVETMSREHGLERVRIAEVADNQVAPVHELAMASRQVVKDDCVQTALGELFAHVRADVIVTSLP